jgi:hypothetical protein
MTNPVRDQLLQNLIELSTLAPEYRFGQMICDLAHMTGNDSPSAAWDVEDAELLKAAEQHIEHWKKIRQGALADAP